MVGNHYKLGGHARPRARLDHSNTREAQLSRTYSCVDPPVVVQQFSPTLRISATWAAFPTRLLLQKITLFAVPQLFELFIPLSRTFNVVGQHCSMHLPWRNFLPQLHSSWVRTKTLPGTNVQSQKIRQLVNTQGFN